MIDIKDILRSFYADKVNVKPYIQDLKIIQELKKINVTTLNIGLGDAIVLTSLTNNQSKEIDIFSRNKHWPTLCKFNNKLSNINKYQERIRTEMLEFFNCGNGHLHQKIQRALGLNIELLPKGYLNPTKEIAFKKNKIAINFSAGPSGLDLIKIGFKNPRRLDEPSKIEVEKFIKNSKYHFVEMGTERMFEFDNVEDFTNRSIEDSINELNSCEFFIGLNSGFMSISAALGIKSIILLNVPHIQDVYLPFMVDFLVRDTGIGEDMAWLFPQNVHLHQHGQNELVPIVSEENIKRAINGEVYPFWKFDFLDLVFDK